MIQTTLIPTSLIQTTWILQNMFYQVHKEKICTQQYITSYSCPWFEMDINDILDYRQYSFNLSNVFELRLLGPVEGKGESNLSSNTPILHKMLVKRLALYFEHT